MPIPESGWDARRIIRCQSCHHKYWAERLSHIDSGVDNEYSGTMFVVYAECPECYALHGAEFSLS